MWSRWGLCLWLLMALVGASSAVTPNSGPLAATDLRVESMPCPVYAIGVKTPRFSWTLAHTQRGAFQTSYKVTVSTTSLTNGTTLIVWDSGTVSSNSTIGVQCGTALQSDTAYEVSVVWTDSNGVSAPPSTATFTTALLDQVRLLYRRNVSVFASRSISSSNMSCCMSYSVLFSTDGVGAFRMAESAR